MHSRYLTLRLFAAATLIVQCFGSSDSQGWKQVKGLKGAMYSDMNYGRACIKLLTSSGPQGCEAPDEQRITAPLVHKKDLAVKYKGQRIVVVHISESNAFLSQLLTDSQLRNQVAGVLLDPSQGRPATHSTAPKFPSAAYALYNVSYQWNPAGTGFNREFFGVPIYMLTPKIAVETARRASYNADNEFKGGRHVARLELPMQARGNSIKCITEETCLPVGGYGVWTAVPLLPDPAYLDPAKARPILMLLAQMDSNAMFHDLAKGAGTAVSGLVAGVVAITLLVRSGAPANYSRQLVFAALAGEGFDYMGSKRMLYEMDVYKMYATNDSRRNESSVQGLSLTLIEQVVEVGQIGAAWNRTSNTSTFYLHSQRGGDFGSADALVNATVVAANATNRVLAKPASSSNPGIPPSSLSSFLRHKQSIAGMVVADFDTAFRWPYYQSEFDDAANVIEDVLESIVDASLLLAHTLHSLASDGTLEPLVLNRSEAALLVVSLADCLLLEVPGMRCPLAQQLINPNILVFDDGSSSAAVTAYPGVISWVAADPRSSYSKENLPGFLFNYLANLTAVPLPNNNDTNTTKEGLNCFPNVNYCPAPLVCVGWKGWREGIKDSAGMGRCRNTTTSYVPAYSTWMFRGGSPNYWKWTVNSTAGVEWDDDNKWPHDTVWTESNWPPQTPTLTVYQQEDYMTQVVTLVVGLLLTAGTAFVSWTSMKLFEHHFDVTIDVRQHSAYYHWVPNFFGILK